MAVEESTTGPRSRSGRVTMDQFDEDEQVIAEAIMEARHIQEFIWDNQSLSRRPFDPDRW